MAVICYVISLCLAYVVVPAAAAPIGHRSPVLLRHSPPAATASWTPWSSAGASSPPPGGMWQRHPLCQRICANENETSKHAQLVKSLRNAHPSRNKSQKLHFPLSILLVLWLWRFLNCLKDLNRTKKKVHIFLPIFNGKCSTMNNTKINLIWQSSGQKNIYFPNSYFFDLRNTSVKNVLPFRAYSIV